MVGTSANDPFPLTSFQFSCQQDIIRPKRKWP
jgi:hypothetical protein